MVSPAVNNGGSFSSRTICPSASFRMYLRQPVSASSSPLSSPLPPLYPFAPFPALSPEPPIEQAYAPVLCQTRQRQQQCERDQECGDQARRAMNNKVPLVPLLLGSGVHASVSQWCGVEEVEVDHRRRQGKVARSTSSHKRFSPRVRHSTQSTRSSPQTRIFRGANNNAGTAGTIAEQ